MNFLYLNYLFAKLQQKLHTHRDFSVNIFLQKREYFSTLIWSIEL